MRGREAISLETLTDVGEEHSTYCQTKGCCQGPRRLRNQCFVAALACGEGLGSGQQDARRHPKKNKDLPEGVRAHEGSDFPGCKTHSIGEDVLHVRPRVAVWVRRGEQAASTDTGGVCMGHEGGDAKDARRTRGCSQGCSGWRNLSAPIRKGCWVRLARRAWRKVRAEGGRDEALAGNSVPVRRTAMIDARAQKSALDMIELHSHFKELLRVVTVFTVAGHTAVRDRIGVTDEGGAYGNLNCS